MTNELFFDALVFKPLTWEGWLQRYSGDIRVGAKVSSLGRPKVGLKLLSPEDTLVMPWYTGGDWRYGKPRTVTPGKNLALIRVPAVQFGTELLLLDGNHRMKELKPAMVLVDYIVVKPNQRNYFIDLINPRWDPK